MQIFVSSRKRASITVPCAFAAYLSSVLEASSPPATPPANQTPAPGAGGRPFTERNFFFPGILDYGRMCGVSGPWDRINFSGCFSFPPSAFNFVQYLRPHVAFVSG